MVLSGFLKNLKHEITRGNKYIQSLFNELFTENAKCGCWGVDCCDGWIQMPRSTKKPLLPVKVLYVSDEGDLYFGTKEQVTVYRDTGVNSGTKIN
jgi:hypothetical protein